MKLNLKKFFSGGAKLFDQYFTVILLLVVVVILSFGFFNVLWPSFKKIQSQGSDKLSIAEQQEARLKQHLAELTQARKNFEGFSKQQINKLREILPEEAEFPELFAQAQDLAERNQLVLTSIDITPVNQGLTFTPDGEPIIIEDNSFDSIKKLEVTMSIVGGQYEDLKNYVSDIEHNLRLFDITSINFGNVAGGPYLITMETYYFP